MAKDINNLVESLTGYFEGKDLKRIDALNAAELIIDLKQNLEKEHEHRVYAEEHADKFLEECEQLNSKLESNNEKEVVIRKDLWGIKHKECPNCKSNLGWKDINYCFNCGIKLK